VTERQIAPALDSIQEEAAFTVLDEVVRLRSEGHDVISLGIGQPDFDPPQHVVEAARRALADGPHGYTPALGLPALRDGVAAHILRRYDVEVSPATVAIVPAGKLTMTFAVQMFARPGAEVLVPDPGFPPYRSAIGFSGATAVGYPLPEATAFGLDAERVLERITPATTLLILNNPSNPTGGAASREQLDHLVVGLAAHPDVMVLSDEIYSGLSFDGPHRTLLGYPQLADRLIVLDGWSKSYAMTGWRLGWGVWPEWLIDPLRKLILISHSCVNVAAQYGGLAALEGPQDFVDEMRSTFDGRRRFVVEAANDLPGFTCATPDGAFYAFPNIEATGRSDDTLARRLLDVARVAVIPGNDFGVNGVGHLRFSYASSMERLEEAFERIGHLLSAEPQESRRRTR